MHICSGDIGSEKADISQSDRQFISLEDDDFCPYEKKSDSQENEVGSFSSLLQEYHQGNLVQILTKFSFPILTSSSPSIVVSFIWMVIENTEWERL